MVETIIVLPVALMLLFAAGEFGRAFWQYNVLSKSVRDAARYAADQSAPGSNGVVLVTPDLTSQVQNLVVYGNTAGTGAPVLQGMMTSNVSVESPGEEDVLVRSTYDYAPIFGLIPDFNGGGSATLFSFEAAVRMRAL
jgi:Flp pilus assembly protein TadG